MLRDHRKRSVVKAITWRVLASLSTMSIVQIFTGNWALSAGVGLVEVLWKMALCYFHEGVWAHVRWGVSHPLSDPSVTKALTNEDMAMIRRKLQELGYR